MGATPVFEAAAAPVAHGTAAPWAVAGARSSVILSTVAALFVALRFIWLGADPSGYLVEEVLTDEGWYAQNARDHSLFGRWVLNEHNPSLVLCPLHTLLLRASYELFGVSFWSTRLPGALAAALTVGLVAFALRRHPRAAALAAALVATQPVLFSLSRAAFGESLQLLFITAAWALASDERRRPGAWLLAGTAAGLAMFAKASAVYAPAFVLAAPFVTAPRTHWRRGLAEAALVAAGGALAALPFLWFLWPHREIFWVELAREGTSSITFLPLGASLVFLFGLWKGNVTVRSGPASSPGWSSPARWPPACWSPSGARRRQAPSARVGIAWAALACAVLGFRPGPALQERYWANLLVPLACLVALGCEPRRRRTSRRESRAASARRSPSPAHRRSPSATWRWRRRRPPRPALRARSRTGLERRPRRSSWAGSPSSSFTGRAWPSAWRRWSASGRRPAALVVMWGAAALGPPSSAGPRSLCVMQPTPSLRAVAARCSPAAWPTRSPWRRPSPPSSTGTWPRCGWARAG